LSPLRGRLPGKCEEPAHERELAHTTRGGRPEKPPPLESGAVPAARRRLRELGYAVGRFPTGARNAITDVAGVRVGHETLIEDPPGGSAVRTGVTAILPHEGNVFAEKVLGACHVINGYGKTTGLTQLAELGTIESPILITSTLAVGAAWEGGLLHMLERNPDAGRDRDTVNVIVGECFDGWLSDARGMHVRPEHARRAIAAADGGEVAEGSVGAGTGTTCLGFKAGVGSASRLTEAEPRASLGALVVTNYGGRRDLHLLLDRPLEQDPAPTPGEPAEPAGGSVVVVLATDAPLSERQLGRLAARATFGLARAGSFAPHPSGDYVIAFSTAHRVPHWSEESLETFGFLRDDAPVVRELFEMAGEATREAVLNSLCVADAMEGRDGHRREAFPYELLEGLPRATA
jgi:D-aminopeptidase